MADTERGSEEKTESKNEDSATENSKDDQVPNSKSEENNLEESENKTNEENALENESQQEESSAAKETVETTEETSETVTETLRETSSEKTHTETSEESVTKVEIISKTDDDVVDEEPRNKSEEPSEIKEKTPVQEETKPKETEEEEVELEEKSEVKSDKLVEENVKEPVEISEEKSEEIVKENVDDSKEKVEEIVKENVDDSKEKDETVDKEETEKKEEQEEQVEDDDQVYHTWTPKGVYEMESTPVTREEVVAVTLGEVKEPKPLPPAPLVVQDGDDQDYARMMLEPIPPIIVPQLLPNGELGSPIQIPEGIPLLARILPKDEDSNREKIPLERLFTPATDSGEITFKKKKLFASSDFYAPNHPTIDDQLELAQKISGSLRDMDNKTSKGQEMYERRKQKSDKWIHQEGGKMVKMEMFESEHASSEMTTESIQPKMKPTMKLVMNPKGVQDHTTVDQHYQQLMEQQHHSTTTNSSSSFNSSSISGPTQMPASPEIVKDIINDMQSPTGKGAALFAKRKKRMDKFIVDETNVQKTSAYQQEQQGFVQQNSIIEKSTSSSSSSQFSSSTQSKGGPLPSLIGTSNKKKSLQERDKEQQQIMEEFLKNREATVKLVKSPWESVLETGNTSSAFQQTEQQRSSMMSSSSSSSMISSSMSAAAATNVPSWLEMPKPVPVADSQPSITNAAPPAAPSSLFPKQPAQGPLQNEVGGGGGEGFGGMVVGEGINGGGLMYTAEVKLVQPTLQNQPVYQPMAAPAAPIQAPAPAAYQAPAAVQAPVFQVPAAAPAPPVVKAPVLPAAAPAKPAADKGVPNVTTQAEMDERRRSVNFNLSASGFGTYNKFYRPVSFVANS